MEEIADNIFIEQCYPGVVSSVLKMSHGLLLVDGPCRADDRQAWQQKLVSLGGGIGQLMVMLDTHTDRLLSIPYIEVPILAHENSLEIIQDLPSVSRVSEQQNGSDSEPYEILQNSRWRYPDMTYSHQMHIFWDDQPVVVSHQTGGHWAGSWVRYDAEKIIFVGDSVVIDQPPFLAWCHLDSWIEELTWLSSDYFKHYKIVSSRNGVVRQKDVIKMIAFLTSVKEVVNNLENMDNLDEGITEMIPGLLKRISFDRELTEHYENRLVWGLSKLLMRTKSEEIKGEIITDV